MIYTILIFILILGVLIGSHELGHFLAAKANGITVKEFSLGMGPRLCSLTKGGTIYSIRLLPIGGACMFEGEDGADSEDANGAPRELSEGAFPNASVWARICTVVAGPFFNFVLAYVLAVIITANSYTDRPVVQELIPDYPAQEAGMQSGDLIVRMNGERIHFAKEIQLITMLNDQNAPITVEYERDGQKYETVLTPQYDQDSGRYLLGFQGYAEYVRPEGLEIFADAFHEVGYGLKSTVKSLRMMIEGRVSKNDVAGPVYMAKMVDDVTEMAKPYGVWAVILNLMNFALLLSVNLGVLNLLPIPALDGGRLVFLLLELLRGKPVPVEKEGMVHLAGFAVLMLFMVWVVFNDITRLIG